MFFVIRKLCWVKIHDVCNALVGNQHHCIIGFEPQHSSLGLLQYLDFVVDLNPADFVFGSCHLYELLPAKELLKILRGSHSIHQLGRRLHEKFRKGEITEDIFDVMHHLLFICQLAISHQLRVLLLANSVTNIAPEDGFDCDHLLSELIKLFL